MPELFTFKFLSPLWLLLLPPVWFILWRFFKYYQLHSMWEQICDPHLLNKLVPAVTKAKKGRWLNWMLTIALTLSILAAAGPSWRTQPVPLFESTAARVIVLDLSRSMLAQDVNPTRFKRAIFKAGDILQSREEGETALVAFAGAAFTVSPLTDDKQTLLNFLDALNPGIMPVQGSRVDLSLSAAQKILLASSSKNAQIFLLTDGVSELEAAREQAAEAKKNGFRVNVLAFGTQQGGPLRDKSGQLARDQQGSLIIAKVFFEDLKSIAKAGGGRFSRMTPANDDIEYLLSSENVNSIDVSKDSTDRTLELPLNDGVWLVWLILPFALMLFRKNVLWLILLAGFYPFDRDAHAFEWSALWKNSEQRAYQALREGDFKQSVELSDNPQVKGSAYYRQKEYENAQSWFARQGSSESFYNLGNALAHQQQFQQAVAAYGRALEIDPKMENALYNKKLIEDFIKQEMGQQATEQAQQDKGDESSDESSDQSQSNQSQLQESGDPSGSDSDNLQADSTAQQREQNRVAPDGSQDDSSEKELAMDEQYTENEQSPESIDRWINRLPDDPSELLRRKFLRDYQRQRSQP